MSFYLSIITTSIDTLILYFILSLGILHAFTFCVQFWKEKYALISKHRRIVSWQRNHSLSNVKERLDFSIEVLYGQWTVGTRVKYSRKFARSPLRRTSLRSPAAGKYRTCVRFRKDETRSGNRYLEILSKLGSGKQEEVSGDRRNTIYISFLGTAVLRVSGLRTPLSFLLKTL